MAFIVATEVTYADLGEGDTIVDKSGNHWQAVGVAHTVTECEFWLADAMSGIKAHRLVKPLGDKVTVTRPAGRAEEVEAREAEVDAAEAPAEECGVCGLWGKHDEECSRDDADDTAAAEEVAEEVMGAEVLATETADHEAAREAADTTGEPMSLPPFEKMTDPEMRSHLYLVHGVYAHDLKTVKSLVKLHAEHHASATLSEATAHNHEGVMP